MERKLGAGHPTLEDFSDFVYSKEKLCREELKMDRKNTDALFFAVTGVAEDNIADRWGKTFELEWMGFIAGHCLEPATLPPIYSQTVIKWESCQPSH